MVFLKIHLVISIGFFVTISFLLKIIFWHRLYVQRTPQIVMVHTADLILSAHIYNPETCLSV